MSNAQILQMVGGRLGEKRAYQYQGWTLDNGVLLDPHGQRWEYEVTERYDARCMDGWRYGARVAAIAQHPTRCRTRTAADGEAGFRAHCSCGWSSRLCALRSQAETVRDDHVTWILDGQENQS